MSQCQFKFALENMLIEKCCACGELVSAYLRISSRTETKQWTDQFERQVPDPDSSNGKAIYGEKCPHCMSLQFGRSVRVGCKSWKDAKDIPQHLIAYRDDYLKALSTSATLTKEDEKYARIRLWWIGNDDRRDALNPAALSDNEKANMERLMLLLDQANSSEMLMLAELLRELSRFDECILLIDHATDYCKATLSICDDAKYIKELAEKQISFVTAKLGTIITMM